MTLTRAQALFYGSKAAKQEGLVSSSKDSHSKIVGRGKYVHEKVTHNVIPSKREEYLEAAEKYFTRLMERGIDELGGVKLTASWETVVGSVGEFTHVLEYEGYKGFDETSRALRNDKVCFSHVEPGSKVDCSCLTGNGEAQLRYLAKCHLSTAPDHLRILFLAFFPAPRLRLPKRRCLRDAYLPAAARNAVAVGECMEAGTGSQKALRCG